MPGNRNGPTRIITSGVMTGTNVLTSTPFGIHLITHPCVQLIWTGTPVGAFVIKASVNYELAPASARWDAITLARPMRNPSGAADSQVVDLTGLPYPYFLVEYTNASGAGVLDAIAFGKGG